MMPLPPKRTSSSIIMCILATLFFLLLLVVVPVEVAAQNCSIIDFCSTSYIPIRFPFRVEGDNQSQNCGYPGFNLSCSNLGRTVLRLHNSGEFFVRKIDYLTQQIVIYDPGNCLPGRLLKLNLSGSPFSASYYEYYTFLNCPVNLTSTTTSSVVRCLSNETNTVVATSDATYASSLADACTLIGYFRVPISSPMYYGQGTANDLGEDLQLSWYEPNCRECEVNGGICGFKNTSSKELGCFRDFERDGGRGLQIFRIICLSITLPAVLCALGIGCFLCCTNRGRGGITSNRNIQQSNGAVVPQPVVIPIGLDESTIESFTKLVLGESRRVTGPNDNDCPICLSEYLPKDVLRCIPECKHCFHANCIDEWLRMNSSCPLCRNSPSPAHVNSQNNTNNNADNS